MGTYVYIGYGPFPVTLTTRIIPFSVGNPELNLYLPLLLGRGHTQCIYSYLLSYRLSNSHPINEKLKSGASVRYLGILCWLHHTHRVSYTPPVAGGRWTPKTGRWGWNKKTQSPTCCWMNGYCTVTQVVLALSGIFWVVFFDVYFFGGGW